ncbi:hypothetical protein F5Y16DRAFT_411940 [Xylariaceae sp. FL0255]|nr:hypothetical protein F5Y16DRAFT_411940 [Xylariaceae sp. FL0255]
MTDFSVPGLASGGVVQVGEVESFFESDGTRIHRAYGEETHWVAGQEVFKVGREPPKQKLTNLLLLYRRSAGDIASTSSINLDLCQCSWDDVLTQLEAAKATSSVSNRKAHKAYRFLAKAASYSEKWIELIPDDYGLSVVRGGLALVFAMATAEVENREKIIRAFEDLPDMIRTMETAKVMNKLAAGTPETDKIDKILERVKRRSEKLESTNLEMGVTFLSQLPTRHDIRDFEHSFLNQVRQVVQSGVQEIIKQTKGDFTAEAKTFVFKMVQENESLKHQNALLYAKNRQIEYERSRQSSPLAGPLLSALDLMQIINVDPTLPNEDLGFSIKQSFRMTPEEQGRARWLMKTQLFQAWTNAARHSISVLISVLATSLIQVPGTVVIHFFCGKHLDQEDGISGPQGLLRSLITQLLLQFLPPQPNLSGINSHEFLRDCYQLKFPALCEVFWLLFEQLPASSTVYCLIDGVAYYEQWQWIDQLRFLVGFFRHIMSTKQLSMEGPYLKVLLASSVKSTEMRDLFDMEREYVSLAAGRIDYFPLVPPEIIAAISPRA